MYAVIYNAKQRKGYKFCDRDTNKNSIEQKKILSTYYVQGTGIRDTGLSLCLESSRCSRKDSKLAFTL